MNTNEHSSLHDTQEDLRAEIARLNERLAALEAHSAGSTSNVSGPTRSLPELDPKEIEKLVSLISAAIAAYLGVKPRIKQIHLTGGGSWAQQGRVTIQASHNLPISHA